MSAPEIKDYSQGYQSPQQHIHIGGGLVLALIALVLGSGAVIGLIMQAILINSLVESKAREAAAVAVVRSGDALQKAQIVEYKFNTMAAELKKHDIDIPTN